MFRPKNSSFFLILMINAFLAVQVYSQTLDKVSVLWCDPLLNIRDISTRNGVRNLVDKAEAAGFQAIALGVKSVSGEVIYESKIAPRLLEWKDYRMPLDAKPVALFREECNRRGIKLYAVFPLFSEGQMVERQGTIYSDHPEWQTTVYAVEREEPQLLPMTQWAYGTIAYANPLLKDVQSYEISVVKEFLKDHDVDGIIFDKGRFYGIESDFSETAKEQFEQYLGGRTIQWWPEEVYELKLVNDKWEVVPGQLFQDWIEFRASAMHTFYNQLIDAVHGEDPTLPVGNFVGSWYPTYYECGINWASESNIPEERWATRDYNKTAIAELCDYMIVGNFFPRINMSDAEKIGAEWWMSVEGSSMLAMEVVNKACPVYGSILIEQFKNDNAQLKLAMQTILKLTNGLIVYDSSYIEKYRLWNVIGEVLLGAGSAPQINK